MPEILRLTLKQEYFAQIVRGKSTRSIENKNLIGANDWRERIYHDHILERLRERRTGNTGGISWASPLRKGAYRILDAY